MKLLFVVAFWATMTGAAEQQSELSRAAAAQLQRLAPFRRSSPEAQPAKAKETKPEQTQSKESRSTRANGKAEQSLRIPIDLNELYRIFSDSLGNELGNARDKRNKPVQLTPAKMEALDKYAEKIMQDERVQSYMQERIKRDGYGGGYGPPYAGGGGGSGGSGAFVSGLAGQLVGSVVGLSGTASKGSSSSSGQSPAPVYGPPAYHSVSYGKPSFSIWDFKRAIINTLIQAVKAIGGGVLALKGQLIKGSGFLVSTKGRIISSAGDAITGLGKSLAASAVVQPPPQPHPGYGGHVGYAYEAPAHIIGHDSTYEGPPPATNAYHSTFGAASDDDLIQPGLLIGKPSPSIDYHPEPVEPSHEYETEIQHAEPVQLEEAEPPKSGYGIKDVVGSLAGTSNFYQPDNSKVPEIQSVEQEPPSIPSDTLQLQDHNQQDNYELYPPLGNGPPPSDDGKTEQQPPKYETPSVSFKNPDEAAPPQQYAPMKDAYEAPPPPPPPPPQKYEYAPVKNTYAPPGTKYGTPDVHPYYPPLGGQLPAHNTPDIQIEISDHDITGFEAGGYGQHRPHPPGLHVVAMQGPLKIPIFAGPHPPEYYKTAGYPHVNSIGPIGKLHTRYRPDFEVQKSLEYELRKRRADSLRTTHRI